MSDNTFPNMTTALSRGTTLRPNEDSRAFGNDYTIQSVLGEPGGFGITYKALASMETEVSGGLGTHRERISVPIAIKEFFMVGCRRGADGAVSMGSVDPEIFQDFKQRFTEEAEILSRFTYQRYIVRVIDFFDENNTSYMVMQYIPGNDLGHILKSSGPIEEHTAVKYIMQVAYDLIDVHREGIIHRDIKPSNIMIMQNDHVVGQEVNKKAVLIDFGAAKESTQTSEKSKYNVHTEAYAAPEQVNPFGKKGTYTDVYALCATMYYLVEGRNPPIVQNRTPEDPPLKLNNASDVLNRVINKGMSFHEKDRYQQCGELISALEELRYGKRIYEDEVFYAKPTRTDTIVSPAQNEKTKAAKQDATIIARGSDSTIIAPGGGDTIIAPGIGQQQGAGSVKSAEPKKSRMRWLLPVAGVAVPMIGLVAYQIFAADSDAIAGPDGSDDVVEVVEADSSANAALDSADSVSPETHSKDVEPIPTDPDPDLEVDTKRKPPQKTELPPAATFDEALEGALTGNRRLDAANQMKDFLATDARMSICYPALAFCPKKNIDSDQFIDFVSSTTDFKSYKVVNRESSSGKLKSLTLELTR